MWPPYSLNLHDNYVAQRMDENTIIGQAIRLRFVGPNAR